MPVQIVTKIKHRDDLSSSCLTIKDNNTIYIHKKDEHPIRNDMIEMFKCHSVLPLESSPNQTYKDVLQDKVNQMQYGQNTVFICYGQYKSGKTHTLFGKDTIGLIPRAVQHILNIKTQLNLNSDRTYKVSVRILRIFNDRLYDVLNNDSEVRIVDKKTVIPIGSIQDLNHITSKILKPGRLPAFNHVIYTFYLKYCMKSTDDNVYIPKPKQCIYSQIHFVEIGSADKLSHFMEKKSYPLYISSPNKKSINAHHQINKFLHRTLESLVTIFTFIKQRSKFVPLRTMKLTHILKDCLSNSKANIIIFLTIIPHEQCLHETLKTLHFGEQIYYQCKSSKPKRKRNKVKIESNTYDTEYQSDNIIQLLHEIKELISCPSKIKKVDISNINHRISDMILYQRHNNKETMKCKNTVHRLENENEVLRGYIEKQNEIIFDWKSAMQNEREPQNCKHLHESTEINNVDSKINDIEERLKQHTFMLQSLEEERTKNMDEESSEITIPPDMFENIQKMESNQLEKEMEARHTFGSLHI